MVMKRFEENKKAVSPVIAVILMVAITVVLAGLLYVWVNSFSTGSESELAYVGFDIDDVYGGWEITILNVQGDDIPLNTISLLIYNRDKVILYDKTISEANPGPLTTKGSTIYPLPSNSSAVISKQTSNPVLGNDSLSDYIGAIFTYKDFNNDFYLSTGDTIRIYSDFDGDGNQDLLYNYYFSIKDISKAHKFVWTVL
jgi:flagellin-like protein